MKYVHSDNLDCIYRSIKTVISVWLDSYPEDFDEPPNYPCLTSIESFAAKHMHSAEVEARAMRCLNKYTGSEELSRPILGAYGEECSSIILCDVSHVLLPHADIQIQLASLIVL